MNRITLYIGAGTLIILGFSSQVFGIEMSSYVSAGLTLMWIGLAQK